MDVAALQTAAVAFGRRLETIKSGLDLDGYGWYPYGSLSNFVHLDKLLCGRHRDVLRYAGSRPILDIGAADGDTAFFLESLGYDVHVLEYPPTNFNGCRGIHALREALGSQIEITELDLDSQFRLPEGGFGLTFVLGLLYHLKNPFYVLENLAKQAEHMLLSTRVTQYNVAEGGQAAVDGINLDRVDLSSVPAAYLVDPLETNNDATNHWMFTQAGLRRILSRTGWDVLDLITVGVTDGSDPATMDHDERAFCFLRSRVFDNPARSRVIRRGSRNAEAARKVAGADDELDRIAGEPTWMYEFDLGAGVRTNTMAPELMDIHRTRAALAEPVARVALAQAGAPASAIDLACSEGWFAHRLLDWGACTVTGIDIRTENIRRAALVRDRLGLDAERMRLETADVFELEPGELGTFDVVLCFGLIYHLENPIGALRIARGLTRGVCLVESQLTEQAAPIRHGWGQTGQFLEQDASWAAYQEPAQLQTANPIASHGGVISLVPNRAALLQAMAAAGFSRCEPLVPESGNPQYVDGQRLVIAGWP